MSLYICTKYVHACPVVSDSLQPYGLYPTRLNGIFQATILEWVAISSSRVSSPPRDQAHVSCLAGGFFTAEPSGKPLYVPYILHFKNHGWQLLSANQGDGFSFRECLAHLLAVALERMDEEALTLTSGHPDCVPLLIWSNWFIFSPQC